MLKKILIANRGEIALRIIRTCKEMGIKTVAVYSEGDVTSQHVSQADEAICIGPAPSVKSYLNVSNIIAAAKITGAEAIHPGYGFLAENAAFARTCANEDIIFIGPSPDAIERMGDKANARDAMVAAGVPVVPGTDGIVNDCKEALQEANRIGYPIMIKASAGGGGKGMRVADTKEEFESAFIMAQNEAKAAFGNPDIYLERCIVEPRHIEMQIVADNYGEVVYLGERDCSLQRRHQKVLEEAPSIAVTQEMREAMGDVAVKAAKAVNYHSVGTIEFLLDKSGEFYFMEMNTRIQVEHPVTEMVTQIDLMKEQIRIAAGEKLGYKQKDICIKGYSIECRINAEDSENNFCPSPGTITAYHAPGGFGVRMDSAVYEGYTIPPCYDSMIGKLIVWGHTREEAIERMKRALGEFVIEGVKTTKPFHLKVLDNPYFRKGDVDTSFMTTRMK